VEPKRKAEEGKRKRDTSFFGFFLFFFSEVANGARSFIPLKAKQ
jgi:hypothetical protein